MTRRRKFASLIYLVTGAAAWGDVSMVNLSTNDCENCNIGVWGVCGHGKTRSVNGRRAGICKNAAKADDAGDDGCSMQAHKLRDEAWVYSQE